MIRHGETDWNAEGRFQGQTDIPLNARGQAQATRNGAVLRELLSDTLSSYDFVASPLGRTRDTMARVRSELGLPVDDYRTDDRLKEVCFGDWEGFTTRELRQRFPERIKERARMKWDFIAPGERAESYEILSWRIGAWLQSVTQPTVCVTHGGVIRTVFKLIAGMPKDEACEMAVAQDQFIEVDREAGRIRWI